MKKIIDVVKAACTHVSWNCNRHGSAGDVTVRKRTLGDPATKPGPFCLLRRLSMMRRGMGKENVSIGHPRVEIGERVLSLSPQSWVLRGMYELQHWKTGWGV